MLLDDFLKDFNEDDNRWWSMDSGEHLNLLQQALDKIADLEREVKIWKHDAREAHETVAAIDEERMALEQQVSRLTAENARLRDAVDGAIAQHLAARQQIEETRAELAASKENAHEWAATADRFCGQLMEAEKQVSRLTEAVEKLAALDDPPITPLHDARVVAGFYRGALLAILTPPPAARQSDDDEKTNNNQRGSK